MNKLVKKSLAGVIAGVMAVTSLVGSISAMAVPTDEAINGIKAVALNQKVTFEKAAEGAQETVYAFTTAKATDNTKTVKYVIDFSSESYVKDTASKKREDSIAVLGVYELEAKTDKLVAQEAAIDSYSEGASTKTYFVDSNGAETLKSTVYSYNDTTVTLTLKEETKYAFAIDTFGAYTVKENNKDVVKNTKAFMTISNYVEAPAAKFVTVAFDDAAEDITTTAKYTNGSYYKTVTKSPTCTVQYIGTDADIVVPDVFDGRRVIAITGFTTILPSSVKSLTLGKNVKFVTGFDNCARLAKVVLNDGLEEIGNGAFADDAALTGQLVIPASVKTIGNYAFYNTNYDSAVITNVDTAIGTGALGIVEVLNDATANPNDTMDAIKDGFFITAPAKAAKVIAYGKANGIAVIDPANCTHVYGEAVVKKATIFAKGSETKTCAVCGNVDVKEIAQKKVTIKSVKSSKKGAITVKTNAVTDKVTAYKVQYATKKDFSNAKTVTVKTTKKALSKTITGLKAGKKYYVRVKAVNGSKTSAYSAKKAVTVKK